MSRPIARLFSIAVLMTGLLCAGSPTRAADSKSPRMDRLKALDEDYESKTNAFEAVMSKAQTKEQRLKALELKPSTAEYGKKFFAIAKEKPTDEAALRACTWIISNYDAEEPIEQLDDALEIIKKNHLTSPLLKIALLPLAYCESEKAATLLKMLSEKGKDRVVRGVANFVMASSRYERYEGDDPQNLAEIEALLQRVKTEYGDVKPDDDEKTLGGLVAGPLYEIQKLQPGMMAPELEGIDVFGKPIKLSNFRGKVVMLVFWGSWCGPCMANVPHENKLMADYAGRPFTVVGVNSNDTQEKAAKTMKENKMKWPSFFDGETGKIVPRWNVVAFPTVYLIDAKGRIRVKYPLEKEDFEKAIEKAVKEAEKK